MNLYRACALHCLLATGVLAGVSLPARAQDPPAWRFDQVLQQAMDHHPLVRGRQSAWAAAAAELDGAQWQRFPSLSAEVPAGSRETGGVVRLEQPLWNGGRINASIDAARRRVDAAQAGIDEERLSLSLRVIAAFTEALRQRARLQAAQANLAEHEKLLDMIKRRVLQSVSSQTDQRLAQARAHQASNEVSQAQQAREGALAQLSQLTGEAVRNVAADGVGLGEPLRDTERERLLRQATDFSPALQRLAQEAQAAEAEIALQRAGALPSLVLRVEKPVGGASQADNRVRTLLMLQMQTGAGLSVQSRVAAAEARSDNALAARATAERELRERFTLDWIEAEASRQRLDNAREVSLTSTQVFESYARQYVIGRKSWNDVLNAVREATQAEFALEDTRAQAIAASLRVAALTGTLAGQTTPPPPGNRPHAAQ